MRRLLRYRSCPLSGLIVQLALVGLFSGIVLGYTTGVSAKEGDRILEVDVSGIKTISKETLLARLQTKPGSPYRDAGVSDDIRRLYALGYFTDVRVDVEPMAKGLRVVFVVKEKPSISSLSIEGNRALKTARVREILGVEVGNLYDAKKLKEGTDHVKVEYSRKGFARVEAVSQVDVDKAANTAQVRVLIDEGPRLRIADILVEGNQAFSDGRIRKLMKTKRKRWWFSGIYNKKVLTEDLERIRLFYRKHGYQDVNVQQDVYRDPKGRGLYVHLTIEEGDQYRVGQVRLAGAVLFPARELRRLVTLKPGSVYNPESLREDLGLIKQYYGDRGYIHTEVTPSSELDQQQKRIHLTYNIAESEKVYVNRIIVRGNLRTKDVVVRRELRIYPGDPFDGASVRKSVERLYNLGYFEEVNVDTEATDVADREDLVVKVKEAKTGSFSFGGGFSSVDRLVGLIELEQRNFDLTNFPNFTGGGQELDLRAELGSVRRFFDLSFTEPWIFGRPLSFGVDLYNRTRLRSRNLGFGFEEKQRGGGIRLSKEFRDEIRVGSGYQFFRTEISDVSSEASADLRAEQGRSDTSMGSLSVSFDRRDNRFEPSRGYYLFSSADLAGGILGGDEDFYRLQGGGSYYWPHADHFVLEGRLRAGIISEYSGTDEVPIFERFFAGGSNTIRGYRERKVGPLDPSSNDPIGGEATMIATIEEVMTVVRDERKRPILRVASFYDVGNVWRNVSDFGESLISGAGFGFRVRTPIGPVRLDVGFPFNEIANEKKKARFHFNVSRGF